MSNKKGWISVHRELLDKPIWKQSTPEQKTILITLLLMADHEGNEWEFEGQKYKTAPGQFVTSLPSIVAECGKGVSIQNVRTALKRFEKLEFLTDKSTKTNRLITILNWGLYQDTKKKTNSETNSHLTDDQQTGNSHLTANNNVIMQQWNNDNKDVSDEDFQKVADYFQSQIGQLFPNDYQILNELCSEFNLSLVCKAIEVSKLNNITKRPMNYMRKCLIDWKTRGLNSREEVERYLNGNGKQDAKKEFKELTPQQIYEAWK